MKVSLPLRVGDLKRVISRDKIVQGFASVDYQGLTKQIKFGSNHELQVQTAFLYKVVSGNLKYVGDLTQLTK